jgi:hypothetical protein
MQMFLRFLPGHTLWQHPLRGRENTQPPPIDASGFLEYVRLDLGHKSN